VFIPGKIGMETIIGFALNVLKNWRELVMKILNFLKYKARLYDIIVYDHQGTLKVGTIVGIDERFTDDIYDLDTGVAILEDNILKKVGNLKRIRKELYGE
jgi:hypothetical protein